MRPTSPVRPLPWIVAVMAALACAAFVWGPGAAPSAPAVEAAPAAPPVNPLADVQRAAGALVGDVAEVLPAGGYTYFRLHDGGWAVVLGAGPAVGERVEARVFAEKRDFRSRRLDRTFATLSFVSLAGG